ncbi:hypothetical protein [Glycomyces albidus]|uniref:Uncharacterized protein n=1 Tax=Glycomyces albidus TaxID=2656774 RepID=A0A6L5G5H1_9ACTN|nr:hypothetical protein [Glycomyces albidus]MQM24870.1 hypothetical protein [Glycomyces albidus]
MTDGKLTSGEADPGSLNRGTFQDQYRTYTVRASGPDAPDSFQVLTGPRNDDVVLVVSGLNSGDLRATWGRFWSRLKPQAKIWVEEQAFRVFYRRGLPTARTATRF